MFPSALTIAGVDSCGGAGIATDLKTFSTLMTHGCCVVTALTAQNTKGVFKVHPVSPEFVRRQFRALMDDLDVQAAKTGVIYSSRTVNTVASLIKECELKAVVVDPVFQSASGQALTTGDAIQAYKKKLLPLAAVVTPNVSEASVLSGVKVDTLKDAEVAARKISEFGVENVVLKGGHLRGKMAVDLFLHKGKISLYSKPRVNGMLHGGGCFFSAALTAFIAHGLNVPDALEKTEALVQQVITFGLKIGGGAKVVNPLIPIYNDASKYDAAQEVKGALDRFIAEKTLHRFVADVGTQMGVALPYPSNIDHVAAVEDRISKIDSQLVAGKVKFGSSSHVARLILACNELNREVRAAVNLHFDNNLLKALEEIGLTVSSFNRRFEPKKIKEAEGETMKWGVLQAAEKTGKLPDVIYDLGEAEKEPMIRLVGRNLQEILDKIQLAAKQISA